MKLTYKQTTALDLLEDDITEEVMYGGAAGGAKSALGSYFQLKRRFKYPGSRGFIGRAIFKTLKDTTLKTFFEIAGKQGLKRGKHFELTGSHDKENPNCILFKNSSVILLRDLADSPSDPDFDELGSLEITDVFIDECGQVSVKAKETLKSRLRYLSFCHTCGARLTEAKPLLYDADEKPIQWECVKCKQETPGLKPKALYASNPVKGWPYSEFYKAKKDGRLESYKAFIQAFVSDNPHAPAAYVQLLKRMPEGPQKQRLLHGNWEYDDDPLVLIVYDKILDVFNNDFEHLKGKRYITCDVARFGKDTTVIGVWEGFRVKLYQYKGLSITETAEKIQGLQHQYGIPNSHTLVDEDGVGGGVVDIVKCEGFVNNSRPMINPIKPDLDDKGNPKPENYDNLKSQCSFRMADRINRSGLYVEGATPEQKEQITEEMEQVKQKEVDGDGKKCLMKKDDIKEALGRSPDFWDTIMMREKFDLKPIRKAGAISL
jgi:hypothetical protein